MNMPGEEWKGFLVMGHRVGHDWSDLAAAAAAAAGAKHPSFFFAEFWILWERQKVQVDWQKTVNFIIPGLDDKNLDIH